MLKIILLVILALSFDRVESREASNIDFQTVFSNENFPTSVDVFETIVINKPGVYDFKNVLHVWKGQSWPCTGDLEHGPQILRVEASNVTIKNFAYLGDGKTRNSHGLGDPIHIATCARGQGNKCDPGPDSVTIDSMYGHACEDLLTTGRGVTHLTVKNSTLLANPDKNTWDKTFQINFGKGLVFENNAFWGGEYCIRILQGVDAVINDNTFYQCRDAVKMGSAEATFANLIPETSKIYFNNNVMSGVKNNVVCDGKEITSKDAFYHCAHKE